MASGKKSKATPKGGGNNRNASSQKKFPVFTVVVVGIVVLGLAVLVLARQTSRPEPFKIDSEVKVIGTPLPAFPSDKTPDTAMGLPAPQVSGTSLDGEPISIGADGKPKVIIFVAHWCPHCQKEVPIVQKWINENGKPEGVELFGVVTGNDEGKPNYPPSSWLRREGWTAPTLIDSKNQQVANAFGLSGFPFWAVVDSQGKIVIRQSGEITAEQLPQLFMLAKQPAQAAPIADPNLSSDANAPRPPG